MVPLNISIWYSLLKKMSIESHFLKKYLNYVFFRKKLLTLLTVPDRYCFSMEPDDLKNPLCRSFFCSSPDSSWVCSLCELREWGTCRHSDAQVK